MNFCEVLARDSHGCLLRKGINQAMGQRVFHCLEIGSLVRVGAGRWLKGVAYNVDAVLGSKASVPDGVRGLTHVLGSTGKHDICLSKDNFLCSADDTLKA